MSHAPSADLESRIARLEAIEAIKSLKARYWYCCDSKDVEGVRDCFLEGPVEIHYDGPVGLVNHRDGGWLISKARFKVCSAVTYGRKDAAVRLLHSGASLPA